MSDAAVEYDRVAYPSSPIEATFLPRLAAAAILNGHPAPAVEGSRVLDVGCGDGHNIIAMAVALPETNFTGLDIAAEPIARGQAKIRALGLRNVELHCLDIFAANTPAFQGFDYVISHGVLAWVPEPVREGLLAAFRNSLAPNGIGYISYNANPEGRIRQIMRDMMMLAAGDVEGVDRAAAGRAIVGLVDGAVRQSFPDSPWASIVGDMAKQIASREDGVLYHDELGGCYTPFYLTEFVAMLHRYGMRYLGDTSLSNLSDRGLALESIQQIHAVTGDDPILFHQLLDFVLLTGFRRSIFCRAGAPAASASHMERFLDLLVGSRFVEDGEDGDGVRFQSSDGSKLVTTADGDLITALRRLQATWPLALSVRQLVDPATRPAALENALFRMAVTDRLEVRTANGRVQNTISPRPEISPLARLDAPSGAVTTLLHTKLRFTDPTSISFVQHLDGTRTISDLAAIYGDGTEATVELMRRFGLLVG